MVSFTPFRHGHLSAINVAPELRHAVQMLQAPEYAAAMKSGTGLSAWDCATCVAAAGCVPIHPHRAVAWMLVCEEPGLLMLPIARKIKTVIRALPYRRIEMSVNADFSQGHKFARLIGMRLETPEPLKAYGALGEDEMLYSIVR